MAPSPVAMPTCAVPTGPESAVSTETSGVIAKPTWAENRLRAATAKTVASCGVGLGNPEGRSLDRSAAPPPPSVMPPDTTSVARGDSISAPVSKPPVNPSTMPSVRPRSDKADRAAAMAVSSSSPQMAWPAMRRISVSIGSIRRRASSSEDARAMARRWMPSRFE